MGRQLAQDPPVIPVKTILRTDPVLGILLDAVNIEPFPAWAHHAAMPTRARSRRLTGLIAVVELIIRHQRAC